MAAQAPDFDRLSNAFSIVSEEAAKFGNIPVFDQGARLLQAFERLEQRMEQRIDQIQQTQTEIQLSIRQMSDRFEIRARSSNRNSAARTQNSGVTFADRQLTPLINSLTGEDIEGFPDTAASLGRMHAATVNRILLALEYGTTGSLEDRRDRLREAIGMKIGTA